MATKRTPNGILDTGLLPPGPWEHKGNRVYAADGEEIAVATRASPRYRNVCDNTALFIALAGNQQEKVGGALVSKRTLKETRKQVIRNAASKVWAVCFLMNEASATKCSTAAAKRILRHCKRLGLDADAIRQIFEWLEYCNPETGEPYSLLVKRVWELKQ